MIIERVDTTKTRTDVLFAHRRASAKPILTATANVFAVPNVIVFARRSVIVYSRLLHSTT